MATGDLIQRNGQYEFQQILFNNSPAQPTRTVHSVRGMYGHEQESTHHRKQQDHGAFPGEQWHVEKTIEISATTDCFTDAQVYSEIDLLSGAWQKQTAEIPWVFQKAGQSKRFLWVRPMDIDLPTSYDMARGELRWNARLLAADPRIYSLAEKTTIVTIAAGSSSAQGTPVNDGFFFGGSHPVIEIDGPTLNPRITNAGDEGRAIRLDGSLASGQTLVIDTWFKTVTIGGLDVVGNGWTVRTDNQWWKLWPSSFRTNTVTYARGNTTGTSTMRIKFRDAWS